LPREHAQLTGDGAASHVLAEACQDSRWAFGARYRAALEQGAERLQAVNITMNPVRGHGNQALLGLAAAGARS